MLLIGILFKDERVKLSAFKLLKIADNYIGLPHSI
jgi:hypothetical protein